MHGFGTSDDDYHHAPVAHHAPIVHHAPAYHHPEPVPIYEEPLPPVAVPPPHPHTEPLPIERYLVEISFPQVFVSYKDNIHCKPLTEMDIEYLVRSKYQNWMQYLINTHFRLELNVNKDQPMPKLQDFLTQEEKFATMKLIQNDFELQDAMARDDVHFSKTYRGNDNPSLVGGGDLRSKPDEKKDSELG